MYAMLNVMCSAASSQLVAIYVERSLQNLIRLGPNRRARVHKICACRECLQINVDH